MPWDHVDESPLVGRSTDVIGATTRRRLNPTRLCANQTSRCSSLAASARKLLPEWGNEWRDRRWVSDKLMVLVSTICYRGVGFLPVDVASLPYVHGSPFVHRYEFWSPASSQRLFVFHRSTLHAKRKRNRSPSEFHRSDVCWACHEGGPSVRIRGKKTAQVWKSVPRGQTLMRRREAQKAPIASKSSMQRWLPSD